MTKTAPAATPHVHKHVAFFYTTLEERMQLLSDYLEEGISNNELCIFATPGSSAQAIADLEAAGFHANEAVDKGTLRIYEMYQTYLPDGKFASDFMLKNVDGFLSDAETQGFKGLRTAGEMRWINVFPEVLPEASKYEGCVNGICTTRSDFTGLCMYPLIADVATTAIIKAALRLHPAFIYDGKLRTNPYAITANTSLDNLDDGDMDSLKTALTCA